MLRTSVSTRYFHHYYFHRYYLSQAIIPLSASVYRQVRAIDEFCKYSSFNENCNKLLALLSSENMRSLRETEMYIYIYTHIHSQTARVHETR